MESLANRFDFFCTLFSIIESISLSLMFKLENAHDAQTGLTIIKSKTLSDFENIYFDTSFWLSESDYSLRRLDDTSSNYASKMCDVV